MYYGYPHSEDDKEDCEILAGFTVYFYFVSRIYSACISHELQLMIQSPTYNSKRVHCCYHIISNLASVVFLVILIATDNLGMSSALMCWNRYSPHSLTNK